MEPAAIHEELKSRFGDAVMEFREGNGDPFIVVNSSHLLEIAAYLKEAQGLHFDSLMCLSSVDYGENYAVVYHLYSMQRRQRVVLKVYVEKTDPRITSVQSVWKAANWHEREAYDLMGIRFEGHPDLSRILLPEDWPGHPLRKDYVFPEEYDGIPCHRE